MEIKEKRAINIIKNISRHDELLLLKHSSG
jgi:hypothetical protein